MEYEYADVGLLCRLDCIPKIIPIDSLLCLCLCAISKAVSTFSGVTRNHHDGKSVLLLRYEAYHEMALRQLLGICGDVRKQWDVHSIAVGHRTGVVGVREVSAEFVAMHLILFHVFAVGMRASLIAHGRFLQASVVIAVSSVHRAESLEVSCTALGARLTIVCFPMPQPMCWLACILLLEFKAVHFIIDELKQIVTIWKEEHYGKPLTPGSAGTTAGDTEQQVVPPQWKKNSEFSQPTVESLGLL